MDADRSLEFLNDYEDNNGKDYESYHSEQYIRHKEAMQYINEIDIENIEHTHNFDTRQLEIIAKLIVNGGFFKSITVDRSDYSFSKAPLTAGYIIKNTSSIPIKIYKDIRDNDGKIIGKRIANIAPNDKVIITRNELGLIAVVYGIHLKNCYIRGTYTEYKKNGVKLPHIVKTTSNDIPGIAINYEGSELKLLPEYEGDFRFLYEDAAISRSKYGKHKWYREDKSNEIGDFDEEVTKFLKSPDIKKVIFRVDSKLDGIKNKSAMLGIVYRKCVNYGTGQLALLVVTGDTLIVYSEHRFEIKFKRNKSIFKDARYLKCIDISTAILEELKNNNMFAGCVSLEYVRLPKNNVISLNDFDTYSSGYRKPEKKEYSEYDEYKLIKIPVQDNFYGCNKLHKVEIVDEHNNVIDTWTNILDHAKFYTELNNRLCINGSIYIKYTGLLNGSNIKISKESGRVHTIYNVMEYIIYKLSNKFEVYVVESAEEADYYDRHYKSDRTVIDVFEIPLKIDELTNKICDHAIDTFIKQ